MNVSPDNVLPLRHPINMIFILVAFLFFDLATMVLDEFKKRHDAYFFEHP